MEKETEEKTGKNVHQGANVRRLRNIMGVKQSSLAEMLGTTQQKVSRIESQRVIEQNMLIQIANILHVSPKIIEELDEKDFVDFVKLGCINLEYDSCIMKRLQEKNWNIALAYMLEEGKGKPEDALVI